MLMTTVWFWLILRSVAASSCSNESPFSSSIIGRRLDLYLTCYPTRYPDHSIVEVNATHLIYFPVHTSYNFGTTESCCLAPRPYSESVCEWVE
ncbi:unnamed protein product [Agarophyton chilense]